MSIRDVIERARRELPYVAPDDPFPESPSVCKVFEPVPWSRQELERIFGFEIPDQLAQLWDLCGGMMLYGDDLWCPGGLMICPPSAEELFRLNSDYQDRKSDSTALGDLIVGEFRSDLELVLIRCDRSDADYGSIMIVAEMDPRPDWKRVALSIEEFLIKYMDAHGEKYWTYHYQKQLADRAAQQNPEGK